MWAAFQHAVPHEPEIGFHLLEPPLELLADIGRALHVRPVGLRLEIPQRLQDERDHGHQQGDTQGVIHPSTLPCWQCKCSFSVPLFSQSTTYSSPSSSRIWSSSASRSAAGTFWIRKSTALPM